MHTLFSNSKKSEAKYTKKSTYEITSSISDRTTDRRNDLSSLVPHLLSCFDNCFTDFRARHITDGSSDKASDGSTYRTQYALYVKTRKPI